MSSSANEAAVRVRGLCVRRGRRLVLSNVDLEVPAGSVLGVIGPNGAGKSTLLSSICGLLRPSQGSVEALGKDLAGMGGRELARLRRWIGLLPQLAEVNESVPLSAREVVEIGRAGRVGPGRRLGPADREAVERALELFGLSDLAGKPYGELSGGERRKTQLARVMAQGPKLILLDEPMANLDATWIERLRQEIGEIWRRSGAAVIMVAHETHHLPDSCGALALMAGGRVVVAGTPQEVLQREWLETAYGRGVEVIERGGRSYLVGA